MRRTLPTLLVCLAALYYLAAGTYKASHFSRDLVPVYSGARCLLHSCNPYDPAQLEQQYLQGGGAARLLGPDNFWRAYVPVYPPSTFLVFFPLALLPFPLASPIWALLSGGLFIAAAVTVLSSCPERYRWVSAILVSLFLVANVNISLLGLGNPTPFAIALLILGTVFFLSNRYIPFATLLLALSLAVKPQIGGLIVLYLLARKIHWQWVVLAMSGALAILLLAGLIFSVHPRSHDWVPALRANIRESIQPSQVNDPSPKNPGAIGIVNLQTITSVFFVDAKIFNAVALVFFALLLAIWVTAALKMNTGPGDHHYLLISALAVLSLLPVYHRSGDDMLLLLTISTIATLLRKRPVLGILAAVFTSLLCTSEFSFALRSHFVERHWGQSGILQHRILFILLLRPQCPLLLLLFGLYLVAMFAGRTATETIDMAVANRAHLV